MKKFLLSVLLALAVTITAQDQLNASFSVENSVTFEKVPGVTIEVYRVYENSFEELIGSALTTSNGTATINTIITAVEGTLNDAPVSYGFTRGNTNLYFRSASQTEAQYEIFDMATGQRLEKGELTLIGGINRIELPNLSAGRRHILQLNINGKIYTQKYIGKNSVNKIKVSSLASSSLLKGSPSNLTQSDSVRLRFSFTKEGFNEQSHEMIYPQGDITDSYYVEFSKIPVEQQLEFAFINTTSDPVEQPIYSTWNGQETSLDNMGGAIDQTLKNYYNNPEQTITISFDQGDEYLRELMIRPINAGFINKNITQNNGEKDSQQRPYVNIPLNKLNEPLYVITTNKGGTLPSGEYLEFTSQKARELWGQVLPQPDYTNHKFIPDPNGNPIGEVALFIDTQGATNADIQNMKTVINQQLGVMNLAGTPIVNYTQILIDGRDDSKYQTWLQEKNSNFYVFDFKGQGGNGAGFNNDGSVRWLTVSMFSGASIDQISSEFSEATGLLDEPTGHAGSWAFVKDAPNNEFYKRLINHIYLKDNKTFRFNDTRTP